MMIRKFGLDIQWGPPADRPMVLSRSLIGILDTAEPHVAGRAVRCIGAARREPIAVAIRAMAEIRAPARHAPVPRRWSGRVVGRPLEMERGAEPIRAPLPDVACHV